MQSYRCVRSSASDYIFTQKIYGTTTSQLRLLQTVGRRQRSVEFAGLGKKEGGREGRISFALSLYMEHLTSSLGCSLRRSLHPTSPSAATGLPPSTRPESEHPLRSLDLTVDRETSEVTQLLTTHICGRPIIVILTVGRGGAMVKSMPFDRRVVGSNPAPAVT